MVSGVSSRGLSALCTWCPRSLAGGTVASGHPSGVAVDVVSSDPAPDDVRFTVRLGLAVLKGRSPVCRFPGHLEHAVPALHSLDSQVGAEPLAVREICYEAPDSVMCVLALLGSEPPVVVLEPNRLLERRH